MIPALIIGGLIALGVSLAAGAAATAVAVNQKKKEVALQNTRDEEQAGIYAAEADTLYNDTDETDSKYDIKTEEAALATDTAEQIRTQAEEQAELAKEQIDIVKEQAETEKAALLEQLGELEASTAYNIKEAQAGYQDQLTSMRAEAEYTISQARSSTRYEVAQAGEQTASAISTTVAGAAASGVAASGSVAEVAGHIAGKFSEFAQFRMQQFERQRQFIEGKVSRFETSGAAKLERYSKYLNKLEEMKSELINTKVSTVKDVTEYRTKLMEKQSEWAQAQAALQERGYDIRASWATLAATQAKNQAAQLRLQADWLNENVEFRNEQWAPYVAGQWLTFASGGLNTVGNFLFSAGTGGMIPTGGGGKSSSTTSSSFRNDLDF